MACLRTGSEQAHRRPLLKRTAEILVVAVTGQDLGAQERRRRPRPQRPMVEIVRRQRNRPSARPRQFETAAGGMAEDERAILKQARREHQGTLTERHVSCGAAQQAVAGDLRHLPRFVAFEVHGELAGVRPIGPGEAG